MREFYLNLALSAFWVYICVCAEAFKQIAVEDF